MSHSERQAKQNVARYLEEDQFFLERTNRIGGYVEDLNQGKAGALALSDEDRKEFGFGRMGTFSGVDRDRLNSSLARKAVAGVVSARLGVSILEGLVLRGGGVNWEKTGKKFEKMSGQIRHDFYPNALDINTTILGPFKEAMELIQIAPQLDKEAGKLEHVSQRMFGKGISLLSRLDPEAAAEIAQQVENLQQTIRAMTGNSRVSFDNLDWPELTLQNDYIKPWQVEMQFNLAKDGASAEVPKEMKLRRERAAEVKKYTKELNKLVGGVLAIESGRVTDDLSILYRLISISFKLAGSGMILDLIQRQASLASACALTLIPASRNGNLSRGMVTDTISPIFTSRISVDTRPEDAELMEKARTLTRQDTNRYLDRFKI